MKSCSRLSEIALGLGAVALLASSASAADWRPVGSPPNALGKVYVDVESITNQDSFKIFHVLTVLPDVETNIHGIHMDSRVTTDALDCQGRKFTIIKTVGMLNGGQVGSTPDASNWRENLKDVQSDSMSRKIYDIVCGAPSQWPAASDTANGPRPQHQPPPQTPGTMASGSGMFIDNDGYVLTNVHVVNGCKSIAVKGLRLPPVPGSVEALDPKNDLALVRIRGGYGEPVTFRSQARPPRLGENVMAMGYPLFGILSNEPKATFGQINSVAGINNDYTLLQVSAPVQPGNSGGPVMDESGMVVGVVVSELSPQMATRIGAVPQNVNFAIRGELAQIFMAAHGVPFAQQASGHRLRNDETAARAEASTAQVFCLKS